MVFAKNKSHDAHVHATRVNEIIIIIVIIIIGLMRIFLQCRDDVSSMCKTTPRLVVSVNSARSGECRKLPPPRFYTIIYTFIHRVRYLLFIYRFTRGKKKTSYDIHIIICDIAYVFARRKYFKKKKKKNSYHLFITVYTAFETNGRDFSPSVKHHYLLKANHLNLPHFETRLSRQRTTGRRSLTRVSS